MTQYRIDTHEFWGTNKTIYEVVMLADQYGNRVSSGNPSGMAVDGLVVLELLPHSPYSIHLIDMMTINYGTHQIRVREIAQ